MRLSTSLFTSAGLALLLAISPVLISFAASVIAQTAGCKLDEGTAHTCIIVGKDYGQTLYEMGVAFWLLILTALYVPVALTFGIAGFITIARGREDSNKNGKTGWVYWLMVSSLLLMPVLGTLSIFLAGIAGLIFWFRKRKSTPHA